VTHTDFRFLDEDEQRRYDDLSAARGSVVLLPLTTTMLEKSIIDAIEPLRELLKAAGIHDYDSQGQGQGHKRLVPCLLIGAGSTGLFTQASLYRPTTKQGDPRIWVYELGGHARAGDVLAVATAGGNLVVVNLRAARAEEAAERLGVGVWFKRRVPTLSYAAMELVDRLRTIARSGPLPAACSGDTAVGRAIETALGIGMNANRAPDFQGVEIKSGRIDAKVRSTMFALVADWSSSPLKSSRELLDRVGYHSRGLRRLNVTVRGDRANAQRLRLCVNLAADAVEEWIVGESTERLLVWRGRDLRARLAAKHPETLWIRARATTTRGRESFQLLDASYTAKPAVARLLPMIAAGHVSLDHVIKETGDSAHERGPLWRIDRSRRDDLFGEPFLVPLS